MALTRPWALGMDTRMLWGFRSLWTGGETVGLDDTAEEAHDDEIIRRLAFVVLPVFGGGYLC